MDDPEDEDQAYQAFLKKVKSQNAPDSDTPPPPPSFEPDDGFEDFVSKVTKRNLSDICETSISPLEMELEREYAQPPAWIDKTVRGLILFSLLILITLCYQTNFLTNLRLQTLREECSTGISKPWLRVLIDLQPRCSSEEVLNAIRSQNLQELNFLILAGGLSKINAGAELHEALKRGNFAILEMLLHAGADPAAPNSEGVPFIHRVLLSLREEDQRRLLQIMFRRNFDLNVKAPDGTLPLDIAIKNGDAGIQELLKKHGASASSSDRL